MYGLVVLGSFGVNEALSKTEEVSPESEASGDTTPSKGKWS